MVENFTQYWEEKGALYIQLGVSREAAHAIWTDAINAAISKMHQQALKNQI